MHNRQAEAQGARKYWQWSLGAVALGALLVTGDARLGSALADSPHKHKAKQKHEQTLAVYPDRSQRAQRPWRHKSSKSFT